MGITTTTGGTEGLDDSGSGSGGATSGSSGATGTSGSTGTSESGAATDATGFDHGAVCPDVYAAVCGKDGETYDNACDAAAAGVEIRREGPCVGDCEGSCVVAPQTPSLLGLVLVVLAFVRPRRRSSYAIME
jgi:MYXO-CTERM domain-containing protein